MGPLPRRKADLPLLQSVGSLFTLVLVALADVFLAGATLSFATLVGSGVIAAAFSILVIDVLRQSSSKESISSNTELKQAVDV